MTDEQAKALGRRLVACEGFRWMPGMLAHGRAMFAPLRVFTDNEVGVSETDGFGDEINDVGPEDWPDLRDPATLGCVLSLVRERWPMASAQRLLGHAVQSVWEVRTPVDPSFPGAYVCRSICEADTEAEALVAALEAAQ